jgi:hypothetical protein
MGFLDFEVVSDTHPVHGYVICAVEGCDEEGHPHQCPYDGRSHHHGCIHYECYQSDDLVWRKGNWFWMCFPHFHQCEAELEARRASQA